MSINRHLSNLKKRIFVFISFICCILVVSCSSPLYYQPALLDLDRSYQPKPMVSDSISSLYSISGSYVNIEHNLKDIQEVFELNISGAHLLKNIHLSYGGYWFGGTYHNEAINKADSYYFNAKNFSGYGLRGSINLVQAEGRFEFRLPGIEFSWSQENGDFARFRKALLNQTTHYTNPKTNLFTAGISNELAWKSENNPEVNYAFKLFFGRTSGDMSYYNANDTLDDLRVNSARMTMDASFLFSMKQFYLVGSLHRFSALKLTMGYALGKKFKKLKHKHN